MYIQNLIILITLRHLIKFEECMQTTNHHCLSHRTVYHHLLISARFSLIPRDRSLSITTDNNIYTQIPKGTDILMVTHHTLHLFVNIYKESFYLQYTYDGEWYYWSMVSSQYLTIYTNLSRNQFTFKRPQRERVIHTMSHTPDLSRTITFPAESIQHQMTMLILAPYMLLLIQVFNTSHISWNIIMYTTTHRQNYGLILETFALTRYHLIWFTSSPTQNPTTTTTTTDWVITFSYTNTMAIAPPMMSLSQPSTSCQCTMITF